MEQYRNHPMTEAARNLDALTEEHGLKQMIKDLGLDLESVMHVASQRALRLVILSGRGEKALKALNTGRYEPVALSPTEEVMCHAYTIGILDGLLIGWKAQAIAQKDSE